MRQQLQVRRLGRRLEEAPDVVVEQDQPGGVRLLEHEVCERGGDVRAVFELRQLAGFVVHRLRDIEQNPSPEVGFFLVFLDVEAVGSSEDFPVEVLEVVAGRVFAVLCELDAVAVEGAFVES